jgi:hypothetical protein
VILYVLVSLTISGCFTLSGDITPPPENSQSTTIPATQQPRPTSTPSEVQPTTESEMEMIGEGMVSVEVLDQTGGALLDEGLLVQLEGFDQFELVYQATEDVDNTGQVLFSDVPMELGYIYFASISYGGAIYRSELVEINQETSSEALFIQVFETTTDNSGLIIDRVHVLLELLQPDLVNVVEIYIISNLSDKTVVAISPGEPSVIFPLPEGAESIGFEDGVVGGRYLLTSDGFGDTVSIPPGAGVYQVLVNYTLPYEGNKIDFKQEMDLPVGAVVVMIPAGSLEIKNSTLNDNGVQNISGGAVQVYSGSSLGAGQTLEFQLTGKFAPAFGQLEEAGQETISLALVLAVFGGLLLLIGIILFFKTRVGQNTNFTSEDDGEDHDHLMDSIIALEDLYKNGEITKEVFDKKNRELKNQLRDIVRK